MDQDNGAHAVNRSGQPHPLIAAALAAPKTHRVVTRYADGHTRHHDCRSAAAAETYAVGERRKVGRELIDRESGAKVWPVAVDVIALQPGDR